MSKANFYSLLLSQVKAITESEPNLIANLANTSAILFEQLDDINWAGFYLTDVNKTQSSSELVLGPFQGKVACVRIPFGRGVCGTAAANKESQLVKDVHAFAGHIACDAASNSEVVVPIIVNEQVVAVLDIDSPSLARFDEQDLSGLTKVAQYIESIWPI